MRFVGLVLAVGLIGCGGTAASDSLGDEGGSAGAGSGGRLTGPSSAGGAAQTGGETSTGGSVEPATGGASTGGQEATGGETSTGGAVATGGVSTGGTASGGTGGTIPESCDETWTRETFAFGECAVVLGYATASPDCSVINTSAPYCQRIGNGNELLPSVDIWLTPKSGYSLTIHRGVWDGPSGTHCSGVPGDSTCNPL